MMNLTFCYEARLNVYAGMAGFYIIRDLSDTGKVDNPLKLPAFPYEIPLVIQDRMFKENGELFYPSFPGDPYYADFITGEGAEVGDDDPTAMAEVFGDHIVVNGKIWPRLEVEPRNYRFRFLNGCDSRFLIIEFVAVELGEVNVTDGEIVPFNVIGGDQGLGAEAVQMQTVVLEPGARLDVVFDFNGYDGKRIIIKNIGGDEPFGGEYPGPQLFNHTDKLVAFDVVGIREYNATDEFDPGMISFPFKIERVAERVRRVGLFEGHDQFGRLQPLLGTVDPATDKDGNPVHWPDTERYRDAGLSGQIMPGTLPWHAPTTENINVGDAEEWEIWNFS
jgi:FtsP/CotA-like multicopper oxidase with cupredoxin domain